MIVNRQTGGRGRDDGKSFRERVGRSSHADWQPPPDRPDPIALLRQTDRGRLPRLVPIRYGRMLADPSAFLRGAAVIMAYDLVTTPTIGLCGHICGDAHLNNFGAYATPERALVFDLNDFDETHVGPWEWDVKRLAASIVVAGRVNGLSDSDCRDAALRAAASYRSRIRSFANMRYLDVWYCSIEATEITNHLNDDDIAGQFISTAQKNTHLGTLPKLVEVGSSGPRIKNDPPLVEHRTYPLAQRISDVWNDYRSSLTEERRVILDRYQLVDIARKVVGVGSVGLRCYVMLLLGRDDKDPLFLQVKEARPSALSPSIRESRFGNEGKRVVRGQRIMQAASDLFLGWTRCGRIDYYVRQLRDMKASVPTGELDKADLAVYAEFCGWALARAHACSMDAAPIGGYLGSGDVFDHAISEFAVAYADQTERDYAALVKAVKSGQVAAETGI
jgi:uncharacterized protein (DUF2252 family)